jgi:hypothetical protein
MFSEISHIPPPCIVLRPLMNVKPKTVIITTIVAALPIVGGLAGFAALSTSANTGLLAATSSANSESSANASTYSTQLIETDELGWAGYGGYGPGTPDIYHQSEVNLTVGQTITITSTSGKYYEVGNSTASGTASGTFIFTVSGKLSTGSILSISSGSITDNGVTYTISSGTAHMALSADGITGQGTTTSSGVFAIQAEAHGSFVGSTAGVAIDFANGATEYGVFLSGTA